MLASLLQQSFERKAWHGPHLLAALRGVTPDEAVWRPQPRRHNVAEQVLHAAYWKYVVRRKLRGDKRGSFPLKGTNWFPVECIDETLWKRNLDLLIEQHRTLVAAVEELTGTTPRRSAAPSRTKSTSRRRLGANGASDLNGLDDARFRLISGIAAHDVYHAGQIRLLRALYADRS